MKLVILLIRADSMSLSHQRILIKWVYTVDEWVMSTSICAMSLNTDT